MMNRSRHFQISPSCLLLSHRAKKFGHTQGIDTRDINATRALDNTCPPAREIIVFRYLTPSHSPVFHVGQTLKYRMNLARSEIKNPLPPLRSGSSFAAKRQEAETCDTIMFIHIQALFNLCTPPKTNMIMGKQLVDDVSPVQNGDVPRPSFPARSFR